MGEQVLLGLPLLAMEGEGMNDLADVLDGGFVVGLHTFAPVAERPQCPPGKTVRRLGVADRAFCPVVSATCLVVFQRHRLTA